MSRTTTSGASTQSTKSAPSAAMPQSTAAQASLPLEKVAKRAFEKWMKGGCKHGCDKQHWFEAEAELRAELTKTGAAAKK